MRDKLVWFRALPFGLAIGLLLLSFIRRVFRIPVTFSFAQGAEDILITYIAQYHFGLNKPGNFIDVGCNAPIRFSNTFSLYLYGWRGLNIDANIQLVEECRRVRKDDVNLHAAVSDTVREVTFHKAKNDAVSTIDEERLIEWKKAFEFSVEDREILITQTLTSILDKYWKFGENIDLLSIDVEGHDFHVLKSLDLSKYRPKIIVIEMHEFSSITESEIYKYLISNQYKLKFFAVLNAYFVDDRSVGH